VQVLAAACACLLAGDASAQQAVEAGQTSVPAVRVVRDRATIWSRNPSLVLAVVEKGAVLQAVAREAQWIEVVVPDRAGGKGNTGFIYAGHVERVEGTPEVPVRPARATESKWEPVGAGAAQPRSTPVVRPTVGVRAFGSFSYMYFQATDSFEAILGEAGQPFFGGGAEVVLWDRLFIAASIERMQQTGERVIVFEDEVFPLGIDDEITITPFTVTAGYRFRSTDRIVPYVGGGIGSYQFREESEFADPDGNVDERFTSYRALLGVEYTAAKWLFASFEVQYTAVPDALGAPGVSAHFDESNLGGVSAYVKLAVGR
jgi:opacity protein-like surface antigen